MNTSRILQLLLALLLLPACALWPRAASATVSCTATATAINFGSVDPQQSSATTANGSISFTCRNNVLLQPAYVTACLNIGAGSGSTTSPYRQMNDGASHTLLFQLYRDAGHSQIWGSILTPATPTPLQLNFIVPGALLGDGVYNSPAYPIYGQVPGSQASVVVGTYQNSFSGTNASISGAVGTSTYPTSCGTSPVIPFPFTVSAAVQPRCTVSATDLNFGNVAGLLSSANHDGSTAVGVTCTNQTTYKVGLNNGLHASGNTRRMAGPGGQLIQYELYRNSGRTLRWGNTPGTDTVDKTGNGSNQNSTVYGRVPMQPTPSAGVYSDTITISVTY